MRLDFPEILEGIFEDDGHIDTWILGKGRRTLIVHEHSAKVSVSSEDTSQLYIPIIDASTTLSTENEDEFIIQVNQALLKPY